MIDDFEYLARALRTPRVPWPDPAERAGALWAQLVGPALDSTICLPGGACRKCRGEGTRAHHRECWLRGAGTRARQRDLAARVARARTRLAVTDFGGSYANEVRMAARWLARTYQLPTAAQVGAVIERMSGLAPEWMRFRPLEARVEVLLPEGPIQVRLATQQEAFEGRAAIRTDSGMAPWLIPTYPLLVLLSGKLTSLDARTASVGTLMETLAVLQGIAESLRDGAQPDA